MDWNGQDIILAKQHPLFCIGAIPSESVNDIIKS